MIHNHDDLYYPRDEAGQVFYTKEETDQLLQIVLNQMIDDGLILMDHNHSDLYYSKAEMDSEFCRLDTPLQVFVDDVDIEALKGFL